MTSRDVWLCEHARHRVGVKGGRRYEDKEVGRQGGRQPAIHGGRKDTWRQESREEGTCKLPYPFFRFDLLSC